jgi:hypothetical protein
MIEYIMISSDMVDYIEISSNMVVLNAKIF